MVPVLEYVFRHMVAERMGTIILSALVAHTGWHWMMDRADQLRQFRFEWPVLDAAMLANTLRVLLAIVVIAGLIWAARAVLRDREQRKSITGRGQPAGGEQASS
jgi:hypothetical protein